MSLTKNFISCIFPKGKSPTKVSKADVVILLFCICDHLGLQKASWLELSHHKQVQLLTWRQVLPQRNQSVGDWEHCFIHWRPGMTCICRHIGYGVDSKVVTEFSWFGLRFWTTSPHLLGKRCFSDPAASSVLSDVCPLPSSFSMKIRIDD